MTFKLLPLASEFYLNSSLYDSFPISESDRQKVFDLIFHDKTIDCYCTKCAQTSVFKPDGNRPVKPKSITSTFTFPIANISEWNLNIEKDTFSTQKIFRCVRDNSHTLTYQILIMESTVQKIGQYPSIADLSSYSIKKFSKTLGKELYSEFNRGIGLFSHGVGVGSFVYLRRIIENFIITPAYEKAKLTADWNDDEFQKLRVTERIKKLRKFLPEFLVQNSTLYSIVSKGIHELSEEECNEYFPVLRECLEYVLTDIQAHKETEEKKQLLTKKIGEITGKLK